MITVHSNCAIKAIVGPVETGARKPQSKRGRHRNMWPPPAPGATRTSSRAAQRGGVEESAGLLPLPARGERWDKQKRSRDACASEFCKYDAQEAEPDPVMRRRW